MHGASPGFPATGYNNAKPGTATPVGTSAAPTIPVATAAPAANGPKQKIVLATTSSLYDTGLLNFLEPKFESQYNVDLQITSQGTGKAIELAKRGDADILLVHSPTQEMAYLEGGNGLNRRTFAYNYFIIVGPSDDPAGIKGMTPEDAFKTIMAKGKAGDKTVIPIRARDQQPSMRITGTRFSPLTVYPMPSATRHRIPQGTAA